MPLPLIHLNDLPPGGRNYSGELRTDIFELSGKYDPKFTPPLKFDLRRARGRRGCHCGGVG